MSANIPLEIQVEIIKRVLPVKSLIRFRSVSKQWKSLIDTSEFITHHSVNQSHQHHLLIRYEEASEYKYVTIVDDDSFPNQRISPTVSPNVKLVNDALMHDCSHGLVCLYGIGDDLIKRMRLIILWNPSIRKSIGIPIPGAFYIIGFGVCPKASDPKIVKIMNPFGVETNWKTEVFTLSSRSWRSVPMNLSHRPLYIFFNQVIIDGVIHWLAESSTGFIVSFDLTSEEFGEINLPDCLADPNYLNISKLNESLVVLNYHTSHAACDVWMMLKNGASKFKFTKLFTVGVKITPSAPMTFTEIFGFRKNGQPVMIKTHEVDNTSLVKELEVYEPCSEHINGIGIYGLSFWMRSYTESLLLLNYSDSIIY